MTAPTSRPARRTVAQVVTRCTAGAGNVAVRGAAALDPERWHVTIVTGSGGRLLDEARAAGMDVVVIPELVSPIAPARDAAALRALTRLFGQRGFDVVHTHSAKAGALGRLAAHRAAVPRVVHTYHGFPFHEFQSPGRRAAYLAVERRLAAITDAFLAVGSGVAAEAVRRGIAAPERLRTIGVTAEPGIIPGTAESRAAARRLLGVGDGTRVVGSVGRLDYQKAPEDLVAALAKVRRTDTVLVLVGNGELRDDTARAARRLGVADRVVLLGERSDVPALLPGFDVFAMASRYEGLPCVLVEAMTCGLPVVATAVNAVPDLVVPGETGLLVPPERPAQLARALEHLLAHPEHAARLARAGQERVAARFEPEVLGRVLAETYDGAPLTGRSPRVPRPRLVHAAGPAPAPTGSALAAAPRCVAPLLPAGAVTVAVGSGRRARAAAVARVVAAPAGAPVVLVGGRPGSRRRLRATAAAAGLSVEREVVVLPSLASGLFAVDDDAATVRWWWRTVAAVPPGMARGSGLAHVAVRLGRAASPKWLGAVAPGRVLVGRRTR